MEIIADGDYSRWLIADGRWVIEYRVWGIGKSKNKKKVIASLVL